MNPSQVRGVYDNCIGRDAYGLRRITDWQPKTVIDIGASVGMFTLASRVLFPGAQIIAVEPAIENFDCLTKQTRLLPGIHRVHAALGHGQIYKRPVHAPSHSHNALVGESYLYPGKWLCENCRPATVAAITLPQLISQCGAENLLIKIDTEGAEDCLVDDKAANRVLRAARYVTMELHFWSPIPELHKQAQSRLVNWVQRFDDTHFVVLDVGGNGGLAWLTKRD